MPQNKRIHETIDLQNLTSWEKSRGKSDKN